MSRFSAITLGTRATKPVEFPLVDGTIVRCAVRVLLGRELAAVLTAARAFAAERGVEAPSDTNPIYQLGVWVHTLVIGCVDIDAPEQSFFDAGADQILDGLDADRIALLYEQQQAWQDHCAPRAKGLSDAGFFELVAEIADSEEGDERPFAKLPRGLLESCTRTLAKLLARSLAPKSPSGPSTDDATKTEGQPH